MEKKRNLSDYRYVVSEEKDEKGSYYVHMRAFPNICVFGSVGTKSHANKVAKTWNEAKFGK